MPAIRPAEFVEKWRRVTLSERAASQEHFLDLCRMLGQPTPAEEDATGAEYTFEKHVNPLGPASKGSKGERGFVDVWWRKKFAWEYKRKDKYASLEEAYRQLCQYREALENPPLLIVCDISNTEIHASFTGYAKQVHRISLDEYAEPPKLDLLRRVFKDPESFRPEQTTEKVTEEIAKQFAGIAKGLRQFEKGRENAGDDSNVGHSVAHFLMKCMFCLFAEDVELLPKALFKKLIQNHKGNPAQLAERMSELFRIMQAGGGFGEHAIKHFNGGLFDAEPAMKLTADGIGKLLIAAAHDWGSVEPAIFGTLFERSLDPNTRAQIGAHYTSRDDIMLVVEPVVMAPLRREWEAVKADVEAQIERRRTAKTKATKSKADKAIEDTLRDFVQRLATIRILDPACGSGNFLYVAIQQLLALEKEVITYAARPEISLGLFPQVRPTQLHGIEINPYAAELAQVVIWIGYLQWMRDNGYIDGIRTPILEPLQTIECRDAILDRSDPEHPRPAKWPDADFIIGNPPFLGGNLVRQGLGDGYVEDLFSTFDLPKFSDLCCYWFELARRQIGKNADARVGLLATQAIRGGVNRIVLDRVKETTEIFVAWSDRDWVLDGAAVHVAIVGFGNDPTAMALLDGKSVATINADLSSGLAIKQAASLKENEGIQHEGDKKGGAFEIECGEALAILRSPTVCDDSITTIFRPWFNGSEINRRLEGNWIIDFPPDMTLERASLYPEAFRVVKERVGAVYADSRKVWWVHERPRPAMRTAIESLSRYPVTTRHSKYRMFTWVRGAYLPDSAVIVFARTDDYFFGVLHSSVHALWALRQGTQLEDRPRYTPTTCFETFPLPWPPSKEPARHEAYKRIATAAKELNEQRERWLNPPEWIEPIAEAVDREDDFVDVPAEARELIRHSAIMARAAKDPQLKKRTLTNLYNERPTWLRLAHEKLDRAVLAAYAATDPQGEWSEDWAELWIDTGAGFPLPDGHPLATRRKEID